VFENSADIERSKIEAIEVKNKDVN